MSRDYVLHETPALAPHVRHSRCVFLPRFRHEQLLGGLGPRGPGRVFALPSPGWRCGGGGRTDPRVSESHLVLEGTSFCALPECPPTCPLPGALAECNQPLPPGLSGSGTHAGPPRPLTRFLGSPLLCVSPALEPRGTPDTNQSPTYFRYIKSSVRIKF